MSIEQDEKLGHCYDGNKITKNEEIKDGYTWLYTKKYKCCYAPEEEDFIKAKLPICFYYNQGKCNYKK